VCSLVVQAKTCKAKAQASSLFTAQLFLRLFYFAGDFMLANIFHSPANHLIDRSK
jgi:hypothetical protein